MPAKDLPADPPSSGPYWLRRLRDARGCRREISRLYGEARAGTIDWADASKGGHILFMLYRMIEGSSFEARLEALEQAAAQDQPTGRPNGHAARPGYRQ